MNDTPQWQPCDKPKLGDTLRWNEPLWAKPTKPRGKRDKIGEQQVTAILLTRSDLLEFKVVDVKITHGENVPTTVQPDDVIKRKKTSIALGGCHKFFPAE